jgi:hypothetical protein
VRSFNPRMPAGCSTSRSCELARTDETEKRGTESRVESYSGTGVSTKRRASAPGIPKASKFSKASTSAAQASANVFLMDAQKSFV